MIVNRIASILALMLICISVSAQKSAREEIAENPYLSGSNHLDYDNYPATAPLTPAPKGYEPYYMSHYGRHGARWLLGDGEYMESIEILRKAKAQGKITNKGNEVLAQLEKFYPCTIKRLGDLTTVGERQHHGIGRRMAEHFPQIFKKKGVTYLPIYYCMFLHNEHDDEPVILPELEFV